MIDPFDHVVIDIIDLDLLPKIKGWAVDNSVFSYWNPKLRRHQLWVPADRLAVFLQLWGSYVKVRTLFS